MSSRAEKEIAAQFDHLAEYILEYFDVLALEGWMDTPISAAKTPAPGPPVDPLIHDALLTHIDLAFETFTPDYLSLQVNVPLGWAYEKGIADGSARIKKATHGKVTVSAFLPMDEKMLFAHQARISESFDGIVRNAQGNLKAQITQGFTQGTDVFKLKNGIEHYFDRTKHPHLHTKYMTTGTGVPQSPRARAMMYMRTTMNDAYNTAARARYQPFTDYFNTIAAADCCDLCEQIESDGPYKYSSPRYGFPPFHPNCGCVEDPYIDESKLETLESIGLQSGRVMFGSWHQHPSITGVRQVA